MQVTPPKLAGLDRKRSLRQPSPRSYPQAVPAESDIRRLRVDDALWSSYAEVVGNGGRSADIRAYIEWRVEHPKMPLPGKHRGPLKRQRRLPES